VAHEFPPESSCHSVEVFSWGYNTKITGDNKPSLFRVKIGISI